MKKITFLKSMLIALIMAGSSSAFGQITSATSGNWSDGATWTGGIAPISTDNVSIGSTHTITVDANAACNNLTLLGAGTGTRLAIGNFTLEVDGTLNGDVTALSATLITSGTGRLKFIGNSRALFGSNWGGNPPSWRFEVALTAGQTGTASTNVKAGDIIITSGTFDLGTNELRPDNNSANTGSLTIEDGAVLKCLRLSRTGTTGTPFASMTMNGTAKFQPNSSTASTTNYLPAVSGGFPVYTFSTGSTIEYVGASSGTISVVPYQNLAVTLANSGGSRSFGASNTIAGNLTITTGTVSFSSGININVGGNLTINGDGVLTSGSGSSTLTGSGASNTLTVNNNGFLTIVNRSTAASPPAAGSSTPFSTQYPGFETITLNSGSTVEYRVPGGTAMGTQDVQTMYGALPLNYQHLTVSLMTTTATQSATQYIPEGLSVAGRLRFTINSTLASNTQDVVFNNTTALTVGSLDITRTGASSLAVQNVKLAGQTYNVTGATTLNNSGPQFQSSSTILNFNGSVTTTGTLTNQGILRFNNFTPTINFNNNLTDGAAATTFSVTGTEVPVINFNNGTSGTPMTTTAANLRGVVTINGYRTVLANGFITTNATAAAYSITVAGTLDLGASTSIATNSGGGTNTLNGNGTIKFTGDFVSQISGYSTNNFQGTGTLHFAGSSAQTIPAGTYTSINVDNAAGVTLVGSTTVTGDLVVNAGSKLTSSGAITATNFTIISNASGTGTFKNNGTLTVSGTSKVQQYLTNQSWYMTSPVQGTVTPTNLSRIQGYNEGVGAGNDWSVTGTTMTALKGYITSVSAAPNTVEFTGTLNNGNISVPMTRQAAGNENKYGFNLIGNPYTAYLDWRDVATANVSKMPTSTMWYRTKVSGSWGFSTVNGTGETTPADVSFLIPPMQAFWVRSSTVGSSTLELTNNMVFHDNNTSNKLKAPAANQTERSKLRLQVTNGTNSDELLIYTDAQASNSFDRFDSPKMSNESADIPEISSIVDKESLVINGLNSLMLDTALPIRFVTKTANAFSLKANQVSNLPEGIKVILKDYGTEFDLTNGAEYNFSSDIADNTNRFSIIFRSTGAVTGLNKNVDNRIVVYSENNGINVSVNDERLIGAEVSVYNALGQKIMSQKLNSSVMRFDNSFTPDVYFVKINSITKKVIVK